MCSNLPPLSSPLLLSCPPLLGVCVFSAEDSAVSCTSNVYRDGRKRGSEKRKDMRFAADFAIFYSSMISVPFLFSVESHEDRALLFVNKRMYQSFVFVVEQSYLKRCLLVKHRHVLFPCLSSSHHY